MPLKGFFVCLTFMDVFLKKFDFVPGVDHADDDDDDDIM